MIWSIIPGAFVFLILWASTKINLGNFEKDETYNYLVPQSAWGNFESLLIFLLVVSIPTYLTSTIAKNINKRNKFKYPNSKLGGWSNSLDEDMWTFLQIIAGVIIAIVGFIYMIFS